MQCFGRSEGSGQRLHRVVYSTGIVSLRDLLLPTVDISGRPGEVDCGRISSELGGASMCLRWICSIKVV